MVTAGIYLMLRLHLFLEWSDTLLLLLAWFGGISALVGALGGLLDSDIKKIIAYSTISQLGYMFIAIGFSQYNLSLWHLVNHAFFKALLFLSAGALLHSVLHIQDLRKYGSLQFILPLLSCTFLLGNLSIIAFPFMTGFFSKDLILEVVATDNSFLFLLIYLAALITASYSIKIFLSSFTSIPNTPMNIWASIHSLSAPTLIIPLVILASGSVAFGYLSSGGHFFDLLATQAPNSTHSTAGFIPLTILLLVLASFMLYPGGFIPPQGFLISP
jgi:NADH-ubiquinone oxidoreductase chain 5